VFALVVVTRILAVSGKNFKAHLFYNLALGKSQFLTAGADFCQEGIPIFVTFGSFVDGSK
jgi:hypothetical protein